MTYKIKPSFVNELKTSLPDEYLKFWLPIGPLNAGLEVYEALDVPYE